MTHKNQKMTKWNQREQDKQQHKHTFDVKASGSNVRGQEDSVWVNAGSGEVSLQTNSN